MKESTKLDLYEVLTSYGEGETIAEYGAHVVRRDAVIHPGILSSCSLYTEVRPGSELVAEGHPVFEPFVLWLRIACENDDMKFLLQIIFPFSLD